jgi:hypothetical protein
MTRESIVRLDMAAAARRRFKEGGVYGECAAGVLFGRLASVIV